MTYSITWSKKAWKQLEKLEANTQDRMIGTLDRCRTRPFTHGKRIVSTHFFSFCSGDYRIVVDIKKAELQILVIEIGHRRNIYR